MRLFAPYLAALLVSCGPAQKSTPNKHAHYQPLSAEDHLAEADRHTAVADAEQAAASSERPGSAVECGRDPVEGQSRIGDEPIRFYHPCFVSVTDPTAAHLKEARDNRREAATHRKAAADLIAAEKQHCAGLDAAALDHSPFYHTEDILEVAPIKDRNIAWGAFFAFRKVRGLSRTWMEKSLTCHQARAAVMGFRPSFMSYCPATVAGARVAVTDAGDKLVVTVRASDRAGGAAIWARAEHLQQEMKKNAAKEQPTP